MELKCKYCHSLNHIKNGFRNGKQNRICKDCGKNFTQGDNRWTDRSQEKAICLLLYARGKASKRFLSRLFKVSARTISVWIDNIASTTSKPQIKADIKEIEIDEMWHYIKKISKVMDT